MMTHRLARLGVAALLCACLGALVIRTSAAAPPAALPAVTPEARQKLLERLEAWPQGASHEVVFAVRGSGHDPHWYANFGYWSSEPKQKMYGAGPGLLVKLNLKTGETTELLRDREGGVRDPAVHYDGGRIVFSYRKGGTDHYHLYEIKADGTGLRQLTDGDCDDIEPCYLPNGDLVFCSSRCNRWVNCWHTEVAVLYRCGPDGRNIRPISSNIEHDNTPSVLPDGRIMYTRWEYVDRSQVDFHHLWTINPDGTNQMTLFGNMHPRTVMIDAKPIPGSDKLAAIFSPGHGRNEHRGPLTLVDPAAGPDAAGKAVTVPGTPADARDPVPLGEDLFLVARGKTLLMLDATQRLASVLHKLSEGGELHEPCLLRPRPREPVILDRTDAKQLTGRLLLADVTHGRNMQDVAPGEVKRLLVVETLPKPVNFSGGPEPLTWLGTFTLQRALGTVPVESDGSAYFELPANRPVFFVALDENDLSIKRMQSFVSVMPGETTSCVGCHERRTEAAPPRGTPQAATRQPSRIEPLALPNDVPDFPRDVQPILDRHCVKCHDWKKPDDRVVLAGDRGLMYSHSYWTLMALGQVVDGRNCWSNLPPRTIGSSASPLMQKIGRPGKPSTHYEVEVSEQEWRTVWQWIECAAPYPGTYAALASGMTHVGAPREVLDRRCYSCHRPPNDVLPSASAAQAANTPRRTGGIPLPAEKPPTPKGPPHGRPLPSKDFASRASQALWNLSRPEFSRMLLAPLAKQSGGWGVCKSQDVAAVFADTEDTDYQKLLAAARAGRDRLEQIKRFDMPGFRPNEHYLREMRRYGILPAGLKPDMPVDPYATDRAYWESFWVK